MTEVSSTMLQHTMGFIRYQIRNWVSFCTLPRISLLLCFLPLGKGILNGSIYALNAPKAGCQDNWYELDVQIHYDNITVKTAISKVFSASIIIDTNFTHAITMRFCIWNGTENTVPHPEVYVADESYDDLMYGDLFHFRKREPEYLDKWPSGKYCIYNVGKLEWSYEGNDWSYGKCPNGFEPGESSYPFVALPGGSGTTRYSPLGPYVVHSNHTRIQFCCSANDVREKSTISLPFVKPFYLLPFETKSCQAVKDTTVRLEWIQWPQLYHEYGLHPYVEEGPYGNGTMFFMCYYVPNVNKLILILTYVITIGSPTLSIAFFCWMGWCHRKRLEWSHNRMLSLQYSGYNKDDSV